MFECNTILHTGLKINCPKISCDRPYFMNWIAVSDLGNTSSINQVIN